MVVIEDNVTYGKAGDTELKLDLARPQGDGPLPAIVFIHGGGWSGGNRQGYHGDQDTLVPVEQAKALDEKMKAVGASHTLIVFQGQGHGFGGEHGKKATDATWEFFDRHLKP